MPLGASVGKTRTHWGERYLKLTATALQPKLGSGNDDDENQKEDTRDE